MIEFKSVLDFPTYLSSSSFKSGVSYDYDSFGCDDCESYCHHYEISDAKVISVDISKLIFDFEHNTTLSDIEKYALDRLCRIFAIYDISKWIPNIGMGYYGDEVDGVSFNDSLDKFKKHLSEINEAETDIEAMNKILIAEYGFILDAYKSCTKIELVEVSMKDIVFPQNAYHSKLKNGEVLYGTDFNLPRGVCYQKDQHYAVIDGYHRLTDALVLNLKTVKVWVISD